VNVTLGQVQDVRVIDYDLRDERLLQPGWRASIPAGGGVASVEVAEDRDEIGSFVYVLSLATAAWGTWLRTGRHWHLIQQIKEARRRRRTRSMRARRGRRGPG
jgi:hypothetical protein